MANQINFHAQLTQTFINRKQNNSPKNKKHKGGKEFRLPVFIGTRILGFRSEAILSLFFTFPENSIQLNIRRVNEQKRPTNKRAKQNRGKGDDVFTS